MNRIDERIDNAVAYALAYFHAPGSCVTRDEYLMACRIRYLESRIAATDHVFEAQNLRDAVLAGKLTAKVTR